MKKRRNRRAAKILVLIITVIILLFAIGVVTGSAYLARYSKAELDMSLLDQASPKAGASRLYAKDGDEWVEISDGLFGGVKYKYVSVSQCPEDLINAFVAIEDKRFWQHEGVDYLRSAMAALNYFKKGNRSFGASTITQQLIKNLTGRDEYTLDRKFSEIFEALELERRVDKRKILEAYLNVINLSEGCRGVGAAAELYFGKEVSELTLSQCARIAAITNNPSVYDPITHIDNNTRRAHLILSEMKGQGYISEEEYEEAINESPRICPIEQRQEQISSWYADMVAEDVICDMVEKLGYTRSQASMEVYNGGLKIYTSMDASVQDVIEGFFGDANNFPKGNKEIFPQSAMMVVDPYTGDILGVAGAIGQKRGNRIQNYATDTRRPPGSAVKPLSVYAPALERGIINWASVFDDVPVKFLQSEGGRYTPWPRNADGIWRGYTTVRDAVAHSVNTVSVRVLGALGEQNSFDFLKNRLHMDSLKSEEDMTVSALALGQASRGVSMRELLGGYTIFNDGVYRRPISYRKVLSSSGEVLLENKQTRHSVISRDNAAIMTELLKTVTTEGTAKKMVLCKQKGIPTAGKTGTTQNNCDRWFVGYTPRLLGAVWMGYDYPTAMDGISGNPCISIWDKVISACHEACERNRDKTDFTLPNGVIKLTYCKDSGEIPTEICANDARGGRLETGYFTLGNMPATECHRHVSVAYDKENGGVLAEEFHFPDACKYVGMIRAERSFPMRIYVTDAQYTYRGKVAAQDMCADENLPYFATAFDGGGYFPISYSTRQFNRASPIALWE